MTNKSEHLENLIRSHKQFCDCSPIWVNGKHGQELKCAKEDVWLWWPIPEFADDLTDDQKISLSVGLPIMYDADGEDVYSILMDGGYKQINSSNFSQAYDYCVRELEKELWKDNVAKQILGRLEDGDLEGESGSQEKEIRSLKVLHPELAKVWQGVQYAVTNFNTNGMTSIVMQCPREDAESWRGIKVKLQMELHRRPTAPVFRLYIEFLERAGSHFSLETFFNIALPDHHEDLRLLSVQDEIIFHFFDSDSQDYLYSKSVNWRLRQREEIGNMLKQGELELSKIRDYDFNRAKAEVQAIRPI